MPDEITLQSADPLRNCANDGPKHVAEEAIARSERMRKNTRLAQQAADEHDLRLAEIEPDAELAKPNPLTKMYCAGLRAKPKKEVQFQLRAADSNQRQRSITKHC